MDGNISTSGRTVMHRYALHGPNNRALACHRAKSGMVQEGRLEDHKLRYRYPTAPPIVANEALSKKARGRT